MRRLLPVLLLALTFTAAQQSEAQVLGTDLSGPEGQKMLQGFLLSAAGTTLPGLAGGAMLYSGDGTIQLLGGGLIAAGMVFGPSLGSWYLGDTRRGITGAAIRGVGTTALITGLGVGFLSADQIGETEVLLSTGLISLSTILLGYGLVYNFTSLPQSVRENRVQISAAYDRESGRVMPAVVVSF
jgi:hypothetical protein